MDRVACKWDTASKGYDFINSRGPHKRWAGYKRAFYGPMRGRVLFLAVGTGLDLEFFPPGQDVTGLDISPGMLEKARPRAGEYDGKVELLEMDAQEMALADDTFDQAFTFLHVLLCARPGARAARATPSAEAPEASCACSSTPAAVGSHST